MSSRAGAAGSPQLVMLAQPPESPPLPVPPPMAPPLSPALCHESGHESRAGAESRAVPVPARRPRCPAVLRTVTPWRPATVPASVRQPGRGRTPSSTQRERRRARQRERERKLNLHRRETFWRKLGRWWRVVVALVRSVNDGRAGSGSVKRKAALRRRRWSSYSAPTLIFQNRPVAYLTVSPPQTPASSKPNVALEVAPRSNVKRPGDHWNYGINPGRGLRPID